MVSAEPMGHLSGASSQQPMELLCPSNATLLHNGLQSLPVLKRYCWRGASRCTRVNSALEWHLENIQAPLVKQTRPALVHRERPSVGAGFAHVLQEQAMVLLLGMVLDRPVLLHTEGAVFNQHGRLVGPEPSLSPALLRSPAAQSAGFPSFLFCRAAKERASASLQLPFRCQRAQGGEGASDGGGSDVAGGGDGGSDGGDDGGGDGGGGDGRSNGGGSHGGSDGGARWFLTLDDGNAWSIIDTLSKGPGGARWNRFTHATRAAPLSDYIPRAPAMFASPSVIAMYLADFVLADETLDVTKRNHRASAAHLAEGRTDLSGPSCLLRALIASVSRRVLTRVVSALEPTAVPSSSSDEGALLGKLTRRNISAHSP